MHVQSHVSPLHVYPSHVQSHVIIWQVSPWHVDPSHVQSHVSPWHVDPSHVQSHVEPPHVQSHVLIPSQVLSQVSMPSQVGYPSIVFTGQSHVFSHVASHVGPWHVEQVSLHVSSRVGAACAMAATPRSGASACSTRVSYNGLHPTVATSWWRWMTQVPKDKDRKRNTTEKTAMRRYRSRRFIPPTSH